MIRSIMVLVAGVLHFSLAQPDKTSIQNIKGQPLEIDTRERLENDDIIKKNLF